MRGQQVTPTNDATGNRPEVRVGRGGPMTRLRERVPPIRSTATKQDLHTRQHGPFTTTHQYHDALSM